MNKLERKSLRQIYLNESLASIIGRLFFSSKAKKTLKGAIKVMKDDPELKAAMADLRKHMERVEDLTLDICDRNPDHPACELARKRKARRYKRR